MTLQGRLGKIEAGPPSRRPGRATLLLLALLWGAFAPSPGLAHGGGLNAEGCHNNRKTGGYHCHRAQGSPARGAQTPPRPYSSQPLGFRSRPVGGAYANCTAARAAGAAPIRRGEPGYGQHLDRDNDGVACEPYRGR